MQNRISQSFGILFVLVLVAVGPAQAQESRRFSIELEAGPVWQSQNDVQIPNDEFGTRFSLVDLAGNGPWLGVRIYGTWNISGRHGMRALIAPLSYTENGTFDETVDFVGESFLPGVRTEASYKFNSYRLTYRYRVLTSDRWRLWVGFTAKIRDAEIELRQGEMSSKDSNVGFVPLLHFAADWNFSERWHLILDLDALAGGPGRAEDLALKVAFDVNEQWSVTAGYRTVEGGVDGDDVYNFAWFHSAVFSGVVRF